MLKIKQKIHSEINKRIERQIIYLDVIRIAIKFS